MCDKCRTFKEHAESSIDRLPDELRMLIRRGPRPPAPEASVLRSILDAGPGEHQNRLWKLAMDRSYEDAMHELEFMMEKYRPEVDAIGRDFAKTMMDLMGEHLHAPERELVN